MAETFTPPPGVRFSWNVPIAAMVAAVVTFGAYTFQAGGIVQRLGVTEQRISALDHDHDLLQRLDERSAATQAMLAEIKAKLDRVP